MKKTSLTSLMFVITIFSPTTLMAEGDSIVEKLGGEIHGFVQFGTDNIVRGISFSNHYPQLKGALLFFHKTGIYFGVAGFNSFLTSGSPGMVPMLGFKYDKDNWGFDLSARYEDFPGFRIPPDAPIDPAIFEVLGTVYYKWNCFKLMGGLGYSPDYYFKTGTGWFPHARLEYKPLSRFKLDMGIGYQTTHDETAPWFKDYTTWDIGAFYDIYNNTWLGVTYNDTDLSRSECNETKLCKSTFVATITRYF